MGFFGSAPLGFLRQDRLRLPLALVAGVLLWALSLPPYGVGVFGVLALVPVLWAIPGVSPSRAAAWGWAGGILWEFAMLWWLIPTLVRYGSIAEPVAVLLIAGMCAILGLYMAGFLWTMAWLVRRRGTWALALAPCAWVLWEWLRGHFLSGMPWWGPGYSLSLYPAFLQFTRVAGILGLSFLAVGVSSAIALWLRDRQARVTGVFVPSVLILVAAVFLWGFWWNGRPPGVKAEVPVGYLQPDIGQDIKWDAAHAAQTLQTTLDLSLAFRKYHLKLMVWPESSTPFEWDTDETYRKKVAEVAAETESPILLGSVLSAGGGYQNGAVLVMPDGREAGRYAKTHLVPFGEYIPFREWLSFAGPIVNTIGDFQPGTRLAPLETPAGRVGVTICFEGIFPDLVREQVRQGAQILVNMTNDAWYEGTPGPYQHYLLERVRAVETDRYLVRSANRGICGVVNPRGVLVATTSGGPASFWGLVAARDTRTPWTRLGYLWLLLPLACVLAGMFAPGSSRLGKP